MNSQKNQSYRIMRAPFVFKLSAQGASPVSTPVFPRHEVMAVDSDSEAATGTDVETISSDTDNECELASTDRMLANVNATVEAAIGPAEMHEPLISPESPSYVSNLTYL